MVMQVYGDSVSGNCLKVRWLAEALGIAFEWIETDVLAGGSRTPAFLAMNPAGQVPLVRFEDGRTLAQSNAILLHLGERSRFVPADAFDRAKMLEWMFWEQYSHEPAVAVARFQVVYKGMPVAALDPGLVARGQAALARLEEATTDGSFLVGPEATLADLALIAYTRVADEGGFALDDYPATVAWIARVEAAFGIAPRG